MLRHSGWFAIALAGVVSAGCVGGGKGLSSSDKDRLKPYILESAPADMTHKLDVNFENKVRIVGSKFEPETGKPGEDVKLTYYWRCDDTLDDGWLLFTHVKDEGRGRLGNLDYDGPIREQKNNHQILGPDRWERGKVYVDEQTYKVPDDVTGSEVTIFTGVWKGDARLRIISGPNDGDNSAIVGKLKTGVMPKPPEQHIEAVPGLSAMKLAPKTKITTDGKGSEAEWGGAASTGPFVKVGSGKPNAAAPRDGTAKGLRGERGRDRSGGARPASPAGTQARGRPGGPAPRGRPAARRSRARCGV